MEKEVSFLTVILSCLVVFCKDCHFWQRKCKVWKIKKWDNVSNVIYFLARKAILQGRIKEGVLCMLRIGICDDQSIAREALCFELEKLLIEGEEEIVYEFSTGSGAVNWLRNHPGEIDLLFLDVEMEGVNGMQAAEQIRGFNQELMIVFVTGYADYVFDGYRVNALDYMLKPVKKERLQEVLGRIRKQISERTEKEYIIKNAEGTYRFPLRDISYFYSDKRKVTLVCQEKEYAFYGKLDEVAEKLSNYFVRIHQRYLVNPDKVDYIGTDCVMMAVHKLPVSRAMKEQAMAGLAKAMLGRSIEC